MNDDDVGCLSSDIQVIRRTEEERTSRSKAVTTIDTIHETHEYMPELTSK